MDESPNFWIEPHVSECIPDGVCVVYHAGQCIILNERPAMLFQGSTVSVHHHVKSLRMVPQCQNM
jgi:hypothetical protein